MSEPIDHSHELFAVDLAVETYFMRREGRLPVGVMTARYSSGNSPFNRYKLHLECYSRLGTLIRFNRRQLT